MDFEKTTAIIKERMKDQDDVPEELPFSYFLNYFKEILSGFQEGQMLVFDGWNHSQEELKQLIETCGNPKAFILLNMNPEN